MTKRLNILVALLLVSAATAMADGKVNTADVVEVYIAIRANADVNIGDWNDGGDIEGGKAEE